MPILSAFISGVNFALNEKDFCQFSEAFLALLRLTSNLCVRSRYSFVFDHLIVNSCFRYQLNIRVLDKTRQSTRAVKSRFAQPYTCVPLNITVCFWTKDGSANCQCCQIFF